MPTQFKKFLLWNKQDMVDEELIFGVVYNTTNQSSLLTRVELELRTKAIDIFNELLPMMGKDVIREKVTHKLHKTAVLLKDKILVAAICFRPCPSKGFSEIVFCGVAEQRRGYGAAIINKFKEFSQANRIKYLLTSADNTAVDFFKKQGFSTKITLKRSRYSKIVEEYLDSQFMQCKLTKVK